MAEVRTIHREQPRYGKYALAGGSLLEGIAGIGALVLSVLGLLGLYPFYMLCTAAILVGVALIMEGSAVTARMASAWHDAVGARFEYSEISSGIGIDYIGGVSGIVLAILALSGVAPEVLLPSAAIVYGVTHVFGSSVTGRSAPSRFANEPDNVQKIANEASRSASEVQTFIGVGSIVLGVLALLSYAPLTLTLVSMLAFGFADMLRGPAMAAKALGRFF